MSFCLAKAAGKRKMGIAEYKEPVSQVCTKKKICWGVDEIYTFKRVYPWDVDNIQEVKAFVSDVLNDAVLWDSESNAITRINVFKVLHKTLWAGKSEEFAFLKELFEKYIKNKRVTLLFDYRLYKNTSNHISDLEDFLDEFLAENFTPYTIIMREATFNFFDEHLKIFLKMCSVDQLELYGCEIYRGFDKDHFPGVIYISTLKISHCYFTNYEADFLADFTRLRSLCIERTHLSGVIGALSWLSTIQNNKKNAVDMPKLERVAFKDCKIDLERDDEQQKSFSTIESLCIESCGIAQIPSFIQYCKKLKYLSLANNDLSSVGESFQYINSLPCLARINLLNTHLGGLPSGYQFPDNVELDLGLTFAQEIAAIKNAAPTAKILARPIIHLR